MQKDLPARKRMRLEGYDYSSAGAYFITICVADRHEMLGQIAVGDGVLDVPPGVPIDVPFVQLSKYGLITEKHIAALNEHYEHISIRKYIIMPNHIHIILFVLNDFFQNNGTFDLPPANGTSRTPSPTNAIIPSFVSTLKRFVHKDCGFVLFQRGYHDHIIRNEAEYQKIWQYSDENPAKWAEDRYFNN